VLVISIGLGVGVAAVIGTLRFIHGWSLKPLIAGALLPTIGLACYMQWGHPPLAALLGLAWDCGGVTTGPVTVPLLLALGIGITRSQRKEGEASNNALEGFGIVTLASLFPVMAVELMAIFIGVTYTEAEVLTIVQGFTTSSSIADKSPLKDVINGIRSILPLNFALILLVWFALGEKLPKARGRRRRRPPLLLLAAAPPAASLLLR